MRASKGRQSMTSHGSNVRIKRVYEQPAAEDGTRVLVDRLWPRGLTKERAHLDLWLKEVAPSTELRRWYGHDPQKFAEFRQRYLEQLREEPGYSAVERLRALARQGQITLLFAAHDAERSEAAVVRDLLVQ
jgi:uncharacterized protein YeaO (DUF488 family)